MKSAAMVFRKPPLKSASHWPKLCSLRPVGSAATLQPCRLFPKMAFTLAASRAESSAPVQVQMALLKTKSHYIMLLIFHYLLCFFFCFFIFQHFFFPAAVTNSQTAFSSQFSLPFSPWETDVASVSRDNSNNSDGSLSVSQHQVLFHKQIIKASSPKDDMWSKILIVRG